MSDGGGRVIQREHIVAAFDGPGVTARASANGPAWMETRSDSAGPTMVFTEAAVLLPLIDRKDGMTVLLTRRTDDLKSHAGQIAFPGGRMEHADPTPEREPVERLPEEARAEAQELETPTGGAPHRLEGAEHADRGAASRRGHPQASRGW